MHLFKISCQQCSHYAQCSPATRMYVNYCGSTREKFKARVDKAIEECRQRGGFYFKHSLLPNIKYLSIEEVLEPLPEHSAAA